VTAGLLVELPEVGVQASVDLYLDRAPRVCAAILATLESPLETRTRHVCFDGQAIYAYLEAFRDAPPIENSTMRPGAGDVMFYRAPANSFTWLHDDSDRLAPRGVDIEANELSFIYGKANLVHDLGSAFYGSLVGRFVDGFEEFAQACAATLDNGNTALRISKA
jgi:hypothetical protein